MSREIRLVPPVTEEQARSLVCGDVVYLNGTVLDPVLGQSWDFYDLAPGRTVLFTWVQVVFDGTEIINVAYVTATDQWGQTVTGESDPVRVDIVHGGVYITKEANTSHARVGDTILWTITVTNPATCDNVFYDGTITDSALGQSWTFDYLRPGQSIVKTVEQEVPDVDCLENEVYVTATDMAGYMVQAYASAVVHVIHPFDVQLAQGWNLVSLPLLADYNASTLGLAPGDVVVMWDTTTQQYKTHVVGLPLNDFPISPSTGYWIYATQVKTLALYGEVPLMTQTRSITVPATGGWALIGMASMNITWRAVDLNVMFSPAGSLSVVVMWNATVQTYKTHIIGLPLNNFPLVPGQAYWVYLSATATLTYVP